MQDTLALISIEWPEVVVTVLNLLILFLLVKKFLFKPVQKILAQRKEQVDLLYSDAEKAKAAAEHDKEVYSEKVGNAEREAAEILRSSHAKAIQAGDMLVREAVGKTSDMKRKAEIEIAQERKKAVNEIKNEISAISVEIAQQVIGREINADDQQALVDEFIDAIGE